MSLTTNPSNPIQELTRQGQSLWLDNLRRELITSGELARLRDAGLTGITSNPTIFEKAIGGSTDYDAALAALMSAGRRPDQMLWDLMLEDIQAAADIFRGDVVLCRTRPQSAARNLSTHLIIAILNRRRGWR